MIILFGAFQRMRGTFVLTHDNFHVPAQMKIIPPIGELPFLNGRMSHGKNNIYRLRIKPRQSSPPKILLMSLLAFSAVQSSLKCMCQS
jgi:hypothetical protein